MRFAPVIQRGALSRLFNGTRQGDKLVKRIEQNFPQLLASSYDLGRMIGRIFPGEQKKTRSRCCG